MSEFCLYPPGHLAALERRRRRCLLAVVLVALAGVALCALGLWLRLLALCIAGLVAGAWLAYYGTDEYLRPAESALAFARHMAGTPSHGFDGVWRSVDPSPVYVEGVRALQVFCERDGARRTFYVRYGDALPPVPAGAAVHIEAVDRFILRFSVAE